MDESVPIDSLLREIDLLAVDDQVHVALQRLVVGDNDDIDAMADEELQTVVSNSTHDLTDNDSEVAASVTLSPTTNGRTCASVETAVTVAQTTSEHKKRKATPKNPTYRVRKEEKNELLSEIEALRARLARLEAQKKRSSLAVSTRENALMRELVRNQQLSLATSQGVVSGLLTGEHSNPLSINHIHLGTDWEDRRRTLLGIKDRTIRHACEHVAARSRFLDPLKRHESEERFDNARGDFCCAQFGIFQYANVSNVKEVYDALVAYLFNIEISVSERLGEITTRDDFDSVEDSIASFRFLSTEFGVPTEKHGVLFMEYFDHHELFDDEPCGVVVIDRVEEDELYPYTPQERMRKDMSLAIVLRPHCLDSGELGVSLSVAYFVKLYRSECPLATPEVIAQLRENVASWGGVFTAAMQEILSQNVA